MDDFKVNVRIKAIDVDPFLNLKGSSLFSLFQDISIKHTEELGYRKDKSLEKGFLWVILKEVINIIRLPKYDEEITVCTFPSKMMHILYPRTCYILDKNGHKIVECRTLWALIDINSRKMVSPSESNINIPDLSFGRKFDMSFAKFMSNDYQKEIACRALYSYCDLNGHINNSKYIDICEDILPFDVIKTKKISLISIEYRHEIKINEKFLIYYKEDKNSYYFFNDAFNLEIKFD